MTKDRSSAATTALSRDIKLANKHGMHARPAAMFIKVAGKFESDIQVEKDGTKVSGKSIMGLLTLELYAGSTMKVHADGPDAEEALDAIEELIRNKFDEE